MRPSASLFILSAAMALCQTPPLTFEAASVKPSAAQTGRYTMRGGPGTSDPGRIAYTNIMLRAVLLNAWDVKNYQLSGPDWIDTLRFDITAVLPPDATREQLQAMLRNLLETRFRMSLHREEKVLPVYALLTAKNGPKIRPLAEAAATPAEPGEAQIATVKQAEGRDGFPVLSMPSPGLIVETKNASARITGKAVSMSKFADMLSSRIGRPVLDATGLTGNFTFQLYFTPDGPNAADGTEPNIFSAVQEQLGLRLEARKAPVELLVIDHAAKVPAEN